MIFLSPSLFYKIIKTKWKVSFSLNTATQRLDYIVDPTQQQIDCVDDETC